MIFAVFSTNFNSISEKGLENSSLNGVSNTDQCSAQPVELLVQLGAGRYVRR